MVAVCSFPHIIHGMLFRRPVAHCPETAGPPQFGPNPVFSWRCSWKPVGKCWRIRPLWTLKIFACSFVMAASMRFLFVRPTFCLRLPSDPTSRRTPLPSGEQFPLPGPYWTLTNQSVHPAGRTKGKVTRQSVRRGALRCCARYL